MPFVAACLALALILLAATLRRLLRVGTFDEGERKVGEKQGLITIQSAGRKNGTSSGNEPEERDPCDPAPRKGYLSVDDYFMTLAFLSGQRSKDPRKQVGSCIVDRQNIILGVGYNGFPRGCPDTSLPWAKWSRNNDKLETKYPFVVHAEANAILNKNNADLRNSRMYVTLFPCCECAKLLIQAGIKEIVYFEVDQSMDSSRRSFACVGENQAR